MRALTARRAAAAMADDVAVLERLGLRTLERPSPFRAVLEEPRGRRRIVARLTRQGRVFGGNWGLELTTADPVLPRTSRGLAARGRGVVRMQGVRFRPRRGRGNAAARALAEALSADPHLGTALSRVDFEQVSVDPDGRPVIRHLGGSVVWVLFPPVVRSTPLPPQQALRALDAFAGAGQRVALDARAHHASNSRSA